MPDFTTNCLVRIDECCFLHIIAKVTCLVFVNLL